MSLLTMCRSTATLKRHTETKDATGGLIPTYSAVSGYSDQPCDIQPASGRVREQYMQKQLAVTHTFYFADDMPARAGDQLVYDSRIFQVQGYTPQAPNYDQWACKVDCEEQYG